jgi:ribosomal-protein-serine acetyltransferase
VNPPELIDLGDFTLRRWRVTDAEALIRAVEESLDHLRPWMAWAGAAGLAGAQERRAFLEHCEEEWQKDWRDAADLTWGIFQGPLVIGSCGLHRRVGPSGLEIGYWVHAAHPRRGHASAASAALTTAAFALPGIDVVVIKNDRANLASQGVPRTLGFTLSGEERRQPVAPAETGVFRVWRMTRDAWAAAHGP